VIIETNPIGKEAASPQLKQIPAKQRRRFAVDFLDFAFSFSL